MKVRKEVFVKRFNARDYVSYSLKKGSDVKISGQIYIPKQDFDESLPDYIEVTITSTSPMFDNY